MSVEITSSKKRPLLKRTDVDFLVEHDAPGLTRKEAVALLSSKLGVEPGKVAIVKMTTSFGSKHIRGHAHVYESVEDMKRIEREHIVARLAEKESESEKE